MNVKIIPRTLILTVFAAFLATGCGGPASGPKSHEPEKVQAVLYTARIEELPLYTTAMGSLEPYRRAQLSTRIMGQVREVFVEEGDRVKKGRLLLRLDKQDITSRIEQSRAMLDAARSQRDNAQAHYGRIKKLYDEQSATKQALDNAHTRLESAEAQVKAAGSKLLEAGSNLGYTAITAPFDGFVTEKNIQAGDLASPGRPLISVERQDSMKIVTTLSEQDVGMISVGEMAWVESDVSGLGRRQACVEAVVPAGDPQTRRFKVRLLMANPERKFKSGMFARVHFKTGIRQTIAVPDSAVIRRGQLYGLFIVDRDTRQSRLRWVRLGRKSGRMVEVLSGLEPGEQVVARGHHLMREGWIVEEVRP
ncbi:MAG: efflux RND transporter periplasmic adaptor subunit [Gemmatimonadota bacterium]|nr:efflux RND transporter periplasmic adaptor subunit [Gemmatimonadota bacterium]